MQRFTIIQNRFFSSSTSASQSLIGIPSNYYTITEDSVNVNGEVVNYSNIRSFLNDSKNDLISNAFVDSLRGIDRDKFIEINNSDNLLSKVFNNFYIEYMNSNGQLIDIVTNTDAVLVDSTVDNSLYRTVSNKSFFYSGNGNSQISKIFSSTNEYSKFSNEESYYIPIILERSIEKLNTFEIACTDPTKDKCFVDVNMIEANTVAKSGVFSQRFTDDIVTDINAADITLTHHSSIPIEVNLTPNNFVNTMVTFKSNNNNIASVNNGVITGNNTGATYVTITSSSGNISKNVDVNVDSLHVIDTIIRDQNGDITTSWYKQKIVNLHVGFNPYNPTTATFKIDVNGNELSNNPYNVDPFIIDGVTYSGFKDNGYKFYYKETDYGIDLLTVNNNGINNNGNVIGATSVDGNIRGTYVFSIIKDPIELRYLIYDSTSDVVNGTTYVINGTREIPKIPSITDEENMLTDMTIGPDKSLFIFADSDNIVTWIDDGSYMHSNLNILPSGSNTPVDLSSNYKVFTFRPDAIFTSQPIEYKTYTIGALYNNYQVTKKITISKYSLKEFILKYKYKSSNTEHTCKFVYRDYLTAYEIDQTDWMNYPPPNNKYDGHFEFKFNIGNPIDSSHKIKVLENSDGSIPSDNTIGDGIQILNSSNINKFNSSKTNVIQLKFNSSIINSLPIKIYL